MKVYLIRSPGTTLLVNGRQYTTECILGQGGFGVVYGARRDVDGRSVAIKETKLDQMTSTKMFHNARMYLNEIELLKRLQQSNYNSVVSILDYDFDVNTGTAYLVEERGVPFEDIIGKRSRVIHEPGRQQYFKGMANALATLHDHQIVHADLKPGNFIVVGGTMKIIDLGTSFTLPNLNVVADRQPIGTPGYMAPEQTGVRGRAVYGYKADIYSLGAILHEMAFGKRVRCPPSNKPLPVHRNPYLNDLLFQMLQISPLTRPNIHQVLSHAYMNYH